MFIHLFKSLPIVIVKFTTVGPIEYTVYNKDATLLKILDQFLSCSVIMNKDLLRTPLETRTLYTDRDAAEVECLHE